jgi:hypothetical protein
MGSDLPVTEFCLFGSDLWWLCMSKAEWSGWVQAAGSIAAILVGVGVVWWQLRAQRKAATADQVRRYRIIAGHLFAARVSLTFMLDAPSGRSVLWDLKRLQQHVGGLAMPAIDMPDFSTSDKLLSIRLDTDELAERLNEVLSTSQIETSLLDSAVESMTSLRDRLKVAEHAVASILRQLGSRPPNRTVVMSDGETLVPEGHLTEAEKVALEKVMAKDALT